MNPAVWPLDRPAKLLVGEDLVTYGDLPRLLQPGDLVVLNDAATLPASLGGRVQDVEVELRLAGEVPGGWLAVLFGPGSWRTPTEHRWAPPRVDAGDWIELAEGARARVRAVRPESPRLLELEFEAQGDAFWAWLYRVGAPVQYSHVAGDLRLAQVQTRYAGPPWAVEPPSAGRPLDGQTLVALRRRGVALAWVTHAAGLSATGDDALDAALPLPERFAIPQATVEAIGRARRVLAVGTTTARALEGAVELWGELRAGEGVTALTLGPGSRLQVVDGLLTGIHEPGSSHHALLGAFASPTIVERALARAEAAGLLLHEFGDGLLLWAPAREAA